VNRPRVVYRPRVDASPEGELNALAAVYKFVLDAKKAVEPRQPDGLNDARKDKDAGTFPYCT
jgi:hypothetical protein